jgi:hypothetical protein
MTTSNGAASLQMQIDAVDARLYARRSRVVAHLSGIGRELRKGMTAPGTVLVAVGIGVVVEQGTRDRKWSLVPILRGLSLTRRLLVMLASMVQLLNVVSAP